jgi:hypothetical protein
VIEGEERSFDSLRSLRISILIGFEERSFVSVLLRTDSLIGCEERSFDWLRSLRINILVGYLVNNKTPSPPIFTDVWQTKDFKSCVFGCVAKRGVTGGFFGSVANTGVSEK